MPFYIQIFLNFQKVVKEALLSTVRAKDEEPHEEPDAFQHAMPVVLENLEEQLQNNASSNKVSIQYILI